MPPFDERPHMAEKEGQEQDLNMRAVDIGIGHEDDFAVPQAGDIEIGADPAAERLDDGDQ